MKRARTSRFAPALVAFVATLAPTPALAQSATREAEAQQLFDEGRELARGGRYAEACPKFAASDELAASGGAVLNLADCYEKTGRSASAWVKFRDAAERAQAAGRPDVARMARDRADALAPRLAKLTVVVEASARVAGLEVRRDGEPMPAGAWGTEVPVDPGRHAVVASAPGHDPASYSVAVAASAHAIVRIGPLRSAPVSPGPESRSRATTAARDAPSSGGLRSLAVVAGGAGLLGVGAGAVLGVMALGKSRDVDAACPNGVCPDEPTRATARDDNDAARHAANASTIAFALGGACLAAGVALYFVAPPVSSNARTATASASARARPAPWRLMAAPTVAGGGAVGVTAAGSF
jgi:serine/threonine-protein kinase